MQTYPSCATVDAPVGPSWNISNNKRIRIYFLKKKGREKKKEIKETKVRERSGTLQINNIVISSAPYLHMIPIYVIKNNFFSDQSKIVLLCSIFICSYLILLYDDYCSLYVQCLTSLAADNVCLYSSKLNPELLSSPQDWTTSDPSSPC